MRLVRKKLVEMYKAMLLIRRFEERAIQLYSRGLISGSVHACIGQEAVAVGACAALEERDYILGTHRGAGHYLAKGGKAKALMAELLGRETGCCQGKGGPMHLAHPESGMLGTSGIVGGGIPIAVGVALALSLKKRSEVVLSFFGDGAANQGSFHEAVNLASIWNLPVVFICENNMYGLSTPVFETMRIKDIARRASSYGIKGDIVDGNDVMAVYEAVSAAVEEARRGNGPTLLEAKTYRREGHYYGDSCNYRSPEEVKEWEKKDPITRFKNKLLKDGTLTDEEVSAIDAEIDKIIAEAEGFAVNSPEPGLKIAEEDIYT